MPDSFTPVDPRRAWARRLARIGEDHGFFDRIGSRHMALFVQEGDTLVLSFDRADALWDNGEAALPLGFDAVLAHEYSLLSLMSVGRTWFRDGQVEAFLKQLAHDGFFRSFAQVLILATGPDCGHAAARAAQHVPGAHVLLSNPMAALGPHPAPFETRFRRDRHANPDWPPPLGPAALARVRQTVILFDGTDASVAAQAALFNGPNTTRVNLPHSGPALDRAVAKGAAVVPLCRNLANGTLSPAKVREILRKILRRDPGYLDRLAKAARAKGTSSRAALIERHRP